MSREFYRCRKSTDCAVGCLFQRFTILKDLCVVKKEQLNQRFDLACTLRNFILWKEKKCSSHARELFPRKLWKLMADSQSRVYEVVKTCKMPRDFHLLRRYLYDWMVDDKAVITLRIRQRSRLSHCSCAHPVVTYLRRIPKWSHGTICVVYVNVTFQRPFVALR